MLISSAAVAVIIGFLLKNESLNFSVSIRYSVILLVFIIIS